MTGYRGKSYFNNPPPNSRLAKLEELCVEKIDQGLNFVEIWLDDPDDAFRRAYRASLYRNSQAFCQQKGRCHKRCRCTPVHELPRVVLCEGFKELRADAHNLRVDSVELERLIEQQIEDSRRRAPKRDRVPTRVWLELILRAIYLAIKPTFYRRGDDAVFKEVGDLLEIRNGRTSIRRRLKPWLVRTAELERSNHPDWAVEEEMVRRTSAVIVPYLRAPLCSFRAADGTIFAQASASP